MTVFAVASVHGAPGATTTVMGLAAAWPTSAARQLLVVEADPDGGVLAARFDDLRVDRTLADVAVDVRRGFDLARVLAAARPVWGGVAVVVAPPSAEQAHAALAMAAERLAGGLAAADDLDVVVDVGRLTTRSPAAPLARRAVVTLVVARPGFEDAAALPARAAELRASGCELGLVTVGDHPYHPAEVATAADLPLLAVLPVDPRAAGLLAGGPGGNRRLHRSLLWRALADLASRLAVLSPARQESAVAPARPAGAGPDAPVPLTPVADNGDTCTHDLDQARAEA